MEQKIQIFKKPIFEFPGIAKDDSFPYLQPLKVVIKLETLVPLDAPLEFKFTLTNGETDRPLKEVKVQAPNPKKQKFTVELPWDMDKTVGDALKPQAIIVDVFYKNEACARTPIMVGVYDPTGKYAIDEDDDFDLEEYEDVSPEELEEMEELEDEEEDEEEQDPVQEQKDEKTDEDKMTFESLAKVAMTEEIAATLRKNVSARPMEGFITKKVEQLNE